MSRRVGTLPLLAHHLRSRSGGAVTVAALILVLSLLATATPLVLSVLADAALRDRLASLGALERDVETTQAGLPQVDRATPTADATTDRVWGGFTDAVERIRSEAGPALMPLLGAARTVAVVTDNAVLEDPRTLGLSVAFDPAFAEQIEMAEGRMPEPATVGGDGGSAGVRMEIVLSTDTADQMGWTVGESRTIGVADALTETVLTGTFTAADPDDEYWQHVTSVLDPNIFDDGNAPRRVTGTGFAHPASLPSAYGFAGQPSTTVWYPFDTGGVEAATAEKTASALRAFTAVSHTVGTTAQGVGILSLRFSADATATIELALAQEAATASVIAMVVAGPVGVAAAVLVLGCRLILERRRSGLRLLSARGASSAQLRGLLGIEGAIVGVLPAALGAAVAITGGMLLFDAAANLPGDLVAAAILALAPLGILVALAGSTAERAERADLGRRSSRARLILEGATLALAAVAVALLFLRGYGSSAGIDPLQAATPLLLALVACLVTLRVYPAPLRAVLARARRSRGLNGFLGAARALREPSIGLTPVLALVVGVSVAVSSGVLLSSLQGGVEQAAQGQVGADLRVTGGTFTAEQLDQVRALDGVRDATGISGAEVATVDTGQRRPTSVFVVDAADLRAVQGERPGLLPSGVSLEPAGGPMPIVVAAATAAFIGASDDVRIDAVPAEVVGISAGPSPIGSRENWVAIDSSYAEEVLGRDPADRTLLVGLADPGSDAGAGVAQALRDTLGGGIRISSADEIVAGIQSGPSVQGVRWALLAATGLAALLSALALVMTLTLAAGARGRVLALLRTLGAPPRTSVSLALWEIGPPAIAAVIAGTLFGALVPIVVLAGVDLRSFTGSSIQPAYSADAGTLALTLGGFLALAALFTAVALLISRRVRAASALRTVEEG
ncbi:MAG: ABC transporter permease [Microbacterium pygmaeum]